MQQIDPIAANKAQRLLDEAYDIRIHDLGKSSELAKKALEISEKLEDSYLIGKSLSHLSLIEMILGDFQKAIQTAERAISHFESIHYDKGIADAKYTIAGALYKTDNFHSGLLILMECLSIFKKYHDHHNQARVLKSMGTIYEYFGDQKKAIESYELAIEQGKAARNDDLQSNAYNPLSGIYLNDGEVRKALELIERSVLMKEKSGDFRGLAFALYGRGKVYASQKEYDKAEKDYLRSIEIHSQVGEKLGLGMSLRKLGSLYKDMGDFERAKAMLKQALALSKAHKIILIKFKASYELYEIAKQEKNLEEAVFYLENYIKEKESVINVQTLKVIESYHSIARVESLELEAKIQKEKTDFIEQKNQDLDAFFYRISHDLKGPITSLIGLDFITKNEVTDPTALKYFNEYLNQVNRMNNILDELISLTKLNHVDEPYKEIDFNVIVNECIQSFHYFPHFSKIHFETKIQEGIRFSNEWSLINTIIQNLIENAIKYGRFDQEQPMVNIDIRFSDRLQITVSDNGKGMTPEIQSKIFQMFYQADSNLRGTGLGLYILKRSVEKCKGEIEVTSELNKGSTFKIHLPKKLM